MAIMLSTFNKYVKHGKRSWCENEDMSLSERMNELFAEFPDRKPADLARFLKVSRASVSGWTNGTTKTIAGDNAFGVAKFFNVEPEWVQNGKGKKRPDRVREIPGTYGQAIRGYVPLISWVQAGDWCEAVDLYAPGDSDEWLPCPIAHGPNTYALKVRGDSMTAAYPGQRSYPEGTIIFIDPTRQLTNGCRVVAKLPNSNEVTFKEYREDAGKRYLKPINPQYQMQEINDETRLCGVVIGQFIAE